MSQVDGVGVTLLSAASDLLATDGPSALTVRRIATKAGVSTMNVYSRFGGKDGVVDRLFMDGFSGLAAGLRAVPFSDDPLDDLHRCGAAYRHFAIENPTYYSVMFDRVVSDFQPSAQATEHAETTLKLLADRLQRAMEFGLLVRHDPSLAAAAVWGACHGLVSLELKQGADATVDWNTVYELATCALLAGLSLPTS